MKIKNSSNKDHGSVLKVIECTASAIENRAYNGGHLSQVAMMMMIMMQVQMQPAIATTVPTFSANATITNATVSEIYARLPCSKSSLGQQK